MTADEMKEMTADAMKEFDLNQLYRTYKERLEVGHPMTLNKGRVNSDNLFRKEIDDKLVWNQFEMRRKDVGFTGAKVAWLFAEYISDEAIKYIKKKHTLKGLHPEHLIPFEYAIGREIRQFALDAPNRRDISEFTLDFFKDICNRLHIAIITEDEMQKLDSKQFGLKSKMPDSWNDNWENITARLAVPNIKVEKMTDTLRNDLYREIKNNH